MKRNFQILPPLDFLAEFTQHIPPKGSHLIRYYGWYSNKSRGMRKKKLAISSTNQSERKSLVTKENRFVPLVVHAKPTMAKVELPGGATIELPSELDREQLDDLIGAVICATNHPNHPSDSAEKG